MHHFSTHAMRAEGWFFIAGTTDSRHCGALGLLKKACCRVMQMCSSHSGLHYGVEGTIKGCGEICGPGQVHCHVYSKLLCKSVTRG